MRYFERCVHNSILKYLTTIRRMVKNLWKRNDARNKILNTCFVAAVGQLAPTLGDVWIHAVFVGSLISSFETTGS